MTETRDRSGKLYRGLIALGVAAGVSLSAALVGVSAVKLEKTPGSDFYIWGIIAASTLATLIILFAGSRLFLRVKAGSKDSSGAEVVTGVTTVDKPHDRGTQGQQGFGLRQFGFLFVLLGIFNLGTEALDRVGDALTGILALDHQPFTLMFALGVTPIMLVLAVAERPAGARIKWRTVIFTAALWPAALLADVIAPYASDFEGPARFVIGFSATIVLIGWIGLGGALGTLDLMFALSNPREYEKKLQRLPLAEGWSFWHSAPLLLLLFSMRWQNGWDGIPEIAGNPLYFAGLLAAATIALSRPRGAYGWSAACLAGAAVATLLLGGAVAAGRAVVLGGTEGDAVKITVHLLLALPAIAVAVVSVIKLSPPASESGGEAGQQ